MAPLTRRSSPAASFSLRCIYRAPGDNRTHTTRGLISHIIILIHSLTPPPPGVNRSVSTTAAQRSDDIFDRIRWTQTTFQIEERVYGLNRDAAKYAVFVPAKARIRVCLSTGVRFTGRIIPCCPPRRRCRCRPDRYDAILSSPSQLNSERSRPQTDADPEVCKRMCKANHCENVLSLVSYYQMVKR